MSYEERVNGAIFDADAAVKSPCANVSLGRVVSALHAVEIARAADAEVYNLRTKLAAETKRADDAEALVRKIDADETAVYDAMLRENREAIARCGLSRVSDKGSLKNDEAQDAPSILSKAFIEQRARAQAAEAQRDKLAELLREMGYGFGRGDYPADFMMPGDVRYELLEALDAALAEMEKHDAK